ncbi:SART-1 family, partial [Rhizoctonia solani]
MSMEESISLEETNKIRISLGLKPLTDDKAPSNDKDQEAEQNYTNRKKQEEDDRKKGQVEIAKNIAKARNRIELNRRLVGATLGDADDDAGVDAKNWIKKAKKKEKELAAKRQAELESMDRMAQATYDERDLEGLKVSHDMDQLNEGEDRILTLKDSRILDNEEDELQNIDMAEDEKDRERHELKTKRRDYTGYDDDEFLPGQAGMKRAVLSKYDEDIDGPKQGQSFRLGAAAQTGPKMSIQDDDTMSVNRALLSLEYTKNVEISDYLKEGDIGFRKPKAKKKRSSRRNQPEESEPAPEPASMDVDEKPAPTFTRRERNLDANFVDDDELQAALARSRRSKARKINKLSPEEIAKRVADEKNEAEAEEAMRNEETAKGGLELDDTSEFVRSVTFDPVAVEPKKLALQLPTLAAPAPSSGQVEDQTIESMEVDDEKEDGEADEEDDEAMLNAIEGMIAAAAGGTMPGEAPLNIKAEEELEIGTAAAAASGRGMAGTLKALKQQGLLSGPDSEVEERERTQKHKDAWLASHRRLLAERELARLRSRGMSKDQAAREYENRVRDQQEARETMESYKDYKPDIELKYYDDTGRELDTKEAWKALSHRFHGKGSGRAKMEKRMKKIAEEKKRQAMIAGDTPLSMNKAFQTRQEKAGQAHMVLSVGNRGAVPQLAEFLDNRDISKANKQADKGKKKKVEGEATPVMSSVDITSFVAPTTTVTASTSQASTPPPPKMKPAFSRVTAEPVSGSASPAGGVGLERGKVAFGFSVKRKAENEGEGSGSPKRR